MSLASKISEGFAAVADKFNDIKPQLPVWTGTWGAPTTGTWTTGQIAADLSGRLWVCLSGGTPGTWVCTTSRRLAFVSDSTLSHTTSTTISSIPTLVVDPIIEDREIIASFYLPYCSLGAAGRMTATLTETAGSVAHCLAYSPNIGSAGLAGTLQARTNPKKLTPGQHTLHMTVVNTLAASGNVFHGFGTDTPAWLCVDEVI